MASTNERYDELLARWRKATLLASCSSQLSWDEQTYLPPGGAAHRADQLSLLAGMVHEQLTAPRLGELISDLERDGNLGESDGPRRANLREARRRYDRATKVPTKLVEEISRVTSLASHNWIEARKKSNFQTFRPWLEKIIGLKREEAAALGSGNGVPYDALLDDYEPGAKTADVAQVFAGLRKDLCSSGPGDPQFVQATGRFHSYCAATPRRHRPRSPGRPRRRSVFASRKDGWMNRPIRFAAELGPAIAV